MNKRSLFFAQCVVTAGLLATSGLDDKGFGDGVCVVFYIFGICFVYFSVPF